MTTEDEIQYLERYGWVVTCARCGKTSTPTVLSVGTAMNNSTGETTQHPACPACRHLLLGLVITEEDT